MDDTQGRAPAKIGRRQLFSAAPLVALGAAAPLTEAQAAPAVHPGVADWTLTTPLDAIVETESGKVRGYLENGVYTYKGIPYGAPTGGKARWLPPRKPETWAGVRETMVFAGMCPQHIYSQSADGPAFLKQMQYDFASEDCLRLNIWTPKVNDGRKRPVMVWFHGGAYVNGTANRAMVHGANMARRGDVVIVSVHHRLNIFGFLDVSAFGEQYKDSLNTGVLDLVASLQWVRDNIANFGGDPGKVTVFGQSGGGAKVGCLLAMPSARGLFHRGIIQSSGAAMREPGPAQRLAKKTFERAGINASNFSKLIDMPMQDLLMTGVAVAAAPLNPGDSWGPTIDGRVVVEQTFGDAPTRLNHDIPLMIGGTRHEFSPPPQPVSEAEMKANLDKQFGAEASAKMRAFLTKEYPGITPNELLGLVNVQPYRANFLKNATRAFERKGAPVYYYTFAWKTPNQDGLPLAFHGAENPFVFNNVTECAPATGNLPEAHVLSGIMCDAWINFARTGDPNHKAMPTWTAFDPARGNTMIFDTRTELVNHPWQAETKAITDAAGGMFAKADAEGLGRPERSGEQPLR